MIRQDPVFLEIYHNRVAVAAVYGDIDDARAFFLKAYES